MILKNKKPEKIAPVILIILFTLFITQIIGEVIVRVYAPQPLNPSLYRFDNYTSFILDSNFSGRSKNFDYDVELFTNEYGLRMDRKWPNNI